MKSEGKFFEEILAERDRRKEYHIDVVGGRIATSFFTKELDEKATKKYNDLLKELWNKAYRVGQAQQVLISLHLASIAEESELEESEFFFEGNRK